MSLRHPEKEIVPLSDIVDRVGILAAGGDEHVYSVSEISNAVHATVENRFCKVAVRGEISSIKKAGSGHTYFNLKDNHSLINTICWRGTHLPAGIEDGMEVTCYGSITTYKARSNYQLIAKKVTISGEGALLALLETRRKKLAAEGIFSSERKKALPKIPSLIGIITSVQGAVLQDILHRIKDRFPVDLLVYDVLVQGPNAEKEIVEAFKYFNALANDNVRNDDSIKRPDLLILARGGGSLEDLWTFNEDSVIYAVARSIIPVISAIGHETDNTLVDLASDMRAPTPTAAAEMAVPTSEEILKGIYMVGQKLDYIMQDSMGMLAHRIEVIHSGLSAFKQHLDQYITLISNYALRCDTSIRIILNNHHHKLVNTDHQKIYTRLIDNISVKNDTFAYKVKFLFKIFDTFIHNKITAMNHRSSLLRNYSYKNTIKRGFAVVRDINGNVVSKLSQVERAQALFIELSDGIVDVSADGG